MRLGFGSSESMAARAARRGAVVLAAALVMTLAAAAPNGALAAPAGAADGGARSAGGGAGTAPGAAGKDDGAAKLDAVVQEVVSMLRAKVSEPVVVHWLDTSGRRPATIGSREIVELKRAGASDPLTTKLLDLAARKAPGEEAAAAAAAASPKATAPRPAGAAAAPAAAAQAPAAPAPAAQAPAAQAPAAPATAAQAPAAPAPAQAAQPPASAAETQAPGAAASAAQAAAAGRGLPGHAANVHWRIAYHPNFGPDDERWDLYVYLDGRYLAWVKSPIVSLLDPPIDFDRALAPGHHVLRVVEERHLHNFGRSGWSHEARVAPAVLAFDLAPDAAGRVELRCEPGQRGGPLRLRVTQGDADVAKTQPAIGEPDAWPLLCEEAAAGRAAGRRAAAAGGREPASCLHWADLWPGVQAPPGRDAVRAELERHDFRPDPARSGD
jgi:hypothetical protein